MNKFATNIFVVGGLIPSGVMCYNCIGYSPDLSNSIIAYADDGGIPQNTPSIPDNPGNGGGVAEQVPAVEDDKPAKPDARDVFGDGLVGEDTSGYADSISGMLQKFVNFLIKLCNYIFIFAMIIHFAIESLMMAFPIIATLMSTKIPIQLFSNECAKVCGVTYSYSSGNGMNGGPGGAGVGSGGGVGGDGNAEGFTGKFVVYFKERSITLIVCGLLLVMCTTGLLPWILNTVINWILGIFF